VKTQLEAPSALRGVRVGIEPNITELI